MELVKDGEKTTRRIHKCIACGKRDLWGPAWTWYGSLRELDELHPDEIKKVCSTDCMTDAEKRGLIYR